MKGPWLDSEMSRRLISLVLAAILVLSTGPVGADPIVDLIAAGRIAEAQALLDATNPSEADRAFFRGRVLKANGQYAEAIAVFRSILRSDPTYINARRELAHTLLLNGEFDAAAHHFESLLQTDSDRDLRKGYRRFLDMIEREQPFGFSTQLALLPSSNVNRGSSNEIFQPDDPDRGPFDITSQAESGIGLLFGLSGYYRWPIAGRDRIVFDWGVNLAKYDNKIHDSATLRFGMTYERRLADYQWSIGPYARRTWRKDNDHNQAFGLRFSTDRRLTQASSLFVEARYEERRYDKSSTLDGPFMSGQVGLVASARADLTFVTGLRLSHSAPEALYQSYDGAAVFGRVIREWPGGLTTGLGLEVGLRDYKDLFPQTTRERQDEFLNINLTLQNNTINWRGFTPVLFCSHQINSSNVAFYDYDASECQIGFSRNF